MGYKFHVGAQFLLIQGGGINFLKGYKFPKGIQSSQRGTYWFFLPTNFVEAWIITLEVPWSFWGANFEE